VAPTPSWFSAINLDPISAVRRPGKYAKALSPAFSIFSPSSMDLISSFYRPAGNKTFHRQRSLYMKLFRFTFCFASLALLASAASTYKVTLTESAMIAGSVVKAGDYRIVVNGDKATLTSGKTTLEVPVKVETGNQKYEYTAVECRSEAGKNMLDDIRVGGTTTTLVFKR
jgi:hypothetical protein